MIKVSTYEQSTAQLNLCEKTGQLFMPAAFINDTEDDIRQLELLIREHAVGGLCFFHSRASAATNFEGVKKVVRNENSFQTLQKLIRRYQSASKYPLLIAVDAEWGLAMRIENSPQYPYAITLGAIKGSGDLTYEVGKAIAKDCKIAGIHWNLAPCVDINNNPDNPVIGYRSFGEDKIEVTKKALAFVKGTQSEGILTSIKHFPGHGDTATDSHLELPLIDKSQDELRANELYPFKKLIEEGVDSIMVGHLSVPALTNGKMVSSSISKNIVYGILREEMGFDGVVISDALNMYAVSKNYQKKGELEWLAFNAGNDVLCFAEHVLEGIDTILKNASETRIEESFMRIWKLKEKAFQRQNQEMKTNTNSNTNTNLSSRLKVKTDHKLNRQIAEHSLTLLKGDSKLLSEFFQSVFLGLSNYHITENHFFKSLHKNKRFNIINLGSKESINKKNILLALFPPQVKPSNKFGFSHQEIDAINAIIQTNNAVLYLFGNPYFLNHLNTERAIAVVVAYQNFKEFQDVAAEHFLGKIEAKGILPVNIIL